MQLPDLVRDQLLQPPQVPIADAELVQLADGVEKVGRARTSVTASTRQHVRNFGKRQVDPIREAGRFGPECQGAEHSLVRIDIDPPYAGQMLIVPDFAAQQPDQESLAPIVGDPMYHPLAAATTSQPHHESRLRG